MKGENSMYSIALDGPAGAGKSTVARELAARLSFLYVDTGAMYRAIALYLIRHQIPGRDKEAVEAAAAQAEVSLDYTDGEQVVLLDGENVNSQIRTEEVGAMASLAGTYQGVREKLVALQQQLALKKNVVMDGRDIGTHVLPNATLKVYLTASNAERAKRRFLQLREKGVSADLAQIESDMRERDRQDMERELSPLRQAEDAILLDSSDLTREEVTETILRWFQERTGK